MTALGPITVNIDGYLAQNRYEVDEGNPHIELVDAPPRRSFEELVRACPAALYKIDADGAQHADFAGCLECGPCRIASSHVVVKSWRFPSATMGVEYRYG